MKLLITILLLNSLYELEFTLPSELEPPTSALPRLEMRACKATNINALEDVQHILR